MKLILNNLDAAYGDTPQVNNINAEIQEGEFIGLIGQNGSGKTCLLKTLACLLKPNKGTISLDEIDIHALHARKRAKRISYLAQSKQMAWSLTARELVALGRTPYHTSLSKFSDSDERAITNALKAAHALDLQDRQFDKLSGGEQMRVHMARALAVNADILIADEPTTALDPYHQIAILNALQRRAAEGRTVLASLHDLTLAKQFCTRIWVIHNGKLMQDGKPEDIFTTKMLADVFSVRPSKHGWNII